MPNKSSPIPMFYQIANSLREEIYRGVYIPRELLPSENDLAIRYGVSRVTIRHALLELEQNQFIYREKGKGTFVAPLPYKGFLGFGSFSQKCRLLGHTPTSKVIRFEEVPTIPDEFEEIFILLKELEGCGSFYLLERVRMMDGIPSVVEQNYLPKWLYPGLDKFDLETHSLYSLMEEQWNVVPAKADQFFSVGIADHSMAKLLQLEPGEPLLLVSNLAKSAKNEIIEFTKGIISKRFLPYHVLHQNYQR